MKKMSRKEEAFWRDLAFRMATHLGCTVKEINVRVRPHCSRKKTHCVITYPFEYYPHNTIFHCWKDAVTSMCIGAYAHRRKNIFAESYQSIKHDFDSKEQNIIELELAGFADLVNAIKQNKIA